MRLRRRAVSLILSLFIAVNLYAAEQLVDFSDDSLAVLNEELRRLDLKASKRIDVVTTIPTTTDAKDGDVAIYQNGTTRRLYFFANNQWNYIGNLDSTGKIVVDGTIDIGAYFKADNVNGMWLGNAAFGSAPFRVNLAGDLVASSATISGSVTATSGNIGGWVIDSTSIKDVAGVVGLSSSVTGADDIRFFAGNTTPASAPFKVTEAGVVTATSGAIGGWVLGTTTLSDNATLANAKVLLDEGNTLIRLGPTTSTYLTLNGNLQKIETSDYVSGALGSGWHVGTDDAEFQNIRARGLIQSSAFQKTAVSSIGGNLLISNSDILNTDMTALDASTLTISGQTTFAVNDILRIKDGTNDEWFTVTNIASAPTYTVTRDMAGSYAANNNPAWKKGTAVVSYGQSGSGLIYMTASDTNSPHIDVLTHAGAPWTTTTTRMRMGNVNGFLGAATDLYGIYIGESSKYLKYDPTNGLQIKGIVSMSSGSDVGGLASSTIAAWADSHDTTTIDGSKIYTGTVTADKISVTQLDAITVNTGTLTVDESVSSSDYVAGTTGFKLDHTAGLEINTGTIEGAIVRPTVFSKFGGNGSDGIATITDNDNFSNICERGHLLIHFDGADAATTYTAESGQTVTFVNHAQLDDAQKEFGATSLLLDGTDDYCTVPDSASWNLSTCDFTLDFWIKLNSTTGYMGILAQTVAAGDDVNNMWECEYNVNTTTDHKMRLVSYSGGVAVCNIISSAAVIADTNWHHVMWVRNGSTVYLFIDGVSKALTVTTAIGTMPDVTGALRIGTNWNKGNCFNGWIDEVHVQKYVARHTSAFTAPTVAYKSTGGIAQFSAFNLESGKTLTVDTGFMYMGVSGSTCHIHGTISADGYGGAAGLAGGIGSNGYSGQDGDWSVSNLAIYNCLGGAGGGASGNAKLGGNGGGAGGRGGDGATSATASAGTATTDSKKLRLGLNLTNGSGSSLFNILDVIRCGGGGGGGVGGAAVADAGGAGGGVIYIECNTLTFDGTLTADGVAGVANGYGSGGGGGGVIIVRGKTISTNSGSVTVTGGAGGDGTVNDGGAGQAGYYDIIDVP